MRTARRKRIHKHTLPHKMKRRTKCNKNANFMFDSKIRDNSAFDLETMNEVLRIHKTARAEGKGSWKLMPKDSCEVYKKRQQKVANSQSDSSDMQKSDTREKRRPRRQAGRKAKKASGTRTRKKHKEGSNDSSVSFSSRSTTNSMSSFTSYSEMDYE